MALSVTSPPQSWASTAWTPGTGSTSYFSKNGNELENVQEYDLDPWGRRTVVWKCIPDGTSNGADGGWNSSTWAVDNTKLYRFSVWMNRVIPGGDGSMYFGLGAFGTTDGCTRLITESWNDNPYFWSTGTRTAIGTNQWVLLVGHTWPTGTTHTSLVKHPDSGRWLVDGTKQGSMSYDWAWHPTTVTARHRAYLYYADTVTDARQSMVYPRCDLIDGTEPTLKDLLRHGRSYMIANLLIN